MKSSLCSALLGANPLREEPFHETGPLALSPTYIAERGCTNVGKRGWINGNAARMQVRGQRRRVHTGEA